MSRTLLVLSFSIYSFFSFAQNIEEKVEEKKTEVNPIQLPQVQPEIIVKEQVLSLEEQGFKAVYINEKLVYRKEINGFIVEFEPTKN